MRMTRKLSQVTAKLNNYAEGMQSTRTNEPAQIHYVCWLKAEHEALFLLS